MIVVIRGRGPQVNPSWWNPQRCDELRASDETAYTTAVLGEFADPESTFIPMSAVIAATREILPPSHERPRKYVAAIDPGTRGNAFTLIVLAAYRDKEGVVQYEVARARQWVGSSVKPLSPAWVLQQIAPVVRPFGITRLLSDQHSADALQDLAGFVGLSLRIVPITTANRNGLFERLGGIFATKTISIPDDKVLARDLASVRRRLTATGITYILPRTSDGRHADYVPALTLALAAIPNAEAARIAARHTERVNAIAEQMYARGYWAPPLPEGMRLRAQAVYRAMKGADAPLPNTIA